MYIDKREVLLSPKPADRATHYNQHWRLQYERFKSKKYQPGEEPGHQPRINHRPPPATGGLLPRDIGPPLGPETGHHHQYHRRMHNERACDGNRVDERQQRPPLHWHHTERRALPCHRHPYDAQRVLSMPGGAIGETVPRAGIPDCARGTRADDLAAHPPGGGRHAGPVGNEDRRGVHGHARPISRGPGLPVLCHGALRLAKLPDPGDPDQGPRPPLPGGQRRERQRLRPALVPRAGARHAEYAVCARRAGRGLRHHLGGAPCDRAARAGRRIWP